ncbi:MAG: hypothetical protein R2764_06240 [Bacteroidales bacterium]
MNRIFIGMMALVELLILGALAYIAVQLIKGPGNELYNLMAMAILLIWFGGLAAYYAWAIYFYNINLGLTNEDWAEIREKKKYMPEGEVKEPEQNPNINQTLGLPTGTVRGTVALTLLVGGLALTIVAVGMKKEFTESAFFIDHFDFFKTAFLMMIAFYFGNKSLEMIGYKSKPGTQINVPGSGSQNGQAVVSGQDAPLAPRSQATDIKNLLQKPDLANVEKPPTQLDLTANDFDHPDAVQ